MLPSGGVTAEICVAERALSQALTAEYAGAESVVNFD
jgi:hypothetical protein